jgi:hypothetical protein
MTLRPFADEATSLQIGGLTVENRLDRVSLYGSLDITRDRDGLRRAIELRALLESVVAALEHEGPSLPETAQPPRSSTTVRNPFGS